MLYFQLSYEERCCRGAVMTADPHLVSKAWTQVTSVCSVRNNTNKWRKHKRGMAMEEGEVVMKGRAAGGR